MEPDKKREPDFSILVMHLESLLLLSTTREERQKLKDAGTYFVIRELHLAIEDERVREGCDRLVQVLMRDEEGEETELKGHALQRAASRGGGGADVGRMVTQVDEEEDEDDQIVEIF